MSFECLENKKLMTADVGTESDVVEVQRVHEKQYIFSTGGDYDYEIHRTLVTDDFVFSTSHDKT